MGKALRVDHVNNYKPPKDDDKLDEETKRLQTEGCAPKPQLPPEAIKKEKADDNIVGGVRLPQRLPIGKIKSESEIKKEKTHKVNKDSKSFQIFSLKSYTYEFPFSVEKGEEGEEKQKDEKREEKQTSQIFIQFR